MSSAKRREIYVRARMKDLPAEPSSLEEVLRKEVGRISVDESEQLDDAGRNWRTWLVAKWYGGRRALKIRYEGDAGEKRSAHRSLLLAALRSVYREAAARKIPDAGEPEIHDVD